MALNIKTYIFIDEASVDGGKKKNHSLLFPSKTVFPKDTGRENLRWNLVCIKIICGKNVFGSLLIWFCISLNAVDAEIVSIDAFTKSPPKRGLVVGITFVKVLAPVNSQLTASIFWEICSANSNHGRTLVTKQRRSWTSTATTSPARSSTWSLLHVSEAKSLCVLLSVFPVCHLLMSLSFPEQRVA